jgi:orotate phosphoribosyltransferase
MGDQIMDTETSQIVRRILREIGSLKEEHVILPSGNHDQYNLDLRPLYSQPKAVSLMAQEMVLAVGSVAVDVVVGQAGHVSRLAAEVAVGLACLSGKEVAHISFDLDSHLAEMGAEGYDPQTGESLLNGRRVLIVHDVAHIELTLSRLIKMATGFGGAIQGVATLVRRARITFGDLGVPTLIYLTDVPFNPVSGSACAYCLTHPTVCTDELPPLVCPSRPPPPPRRLLLGPSVSDELATVSGDIA